MEEQMKRQAAETADSQDEKQTQSLLNIIQKKIEHQQIFFSIEITPYSTYGRKPTESVLSKSMGAMKEGGVLFCSVASHISNSDRRVWENDSLYEAAYVHNYCGLESMLHIPACSLTKTDALEYLNKVRELGVRNILAVRGDVNLGVEGQKDKFQHAKEFVKFIRDNFEDYFTIAVAGYPTGHPEANFYEEDLKNLKDKVDAGADLIITQYFYYASTFINFVKDCRRIGIDIPILPGIFVIQSYRSLNYLANVTKLPIPPEIQNDVEPMKNDDKAITKYGIEHAIKMCREILDSGLAGGLHFFTINRLEGPAQVCHRLGLWNGCFNIEDLRNNPLC